MNNQPGSSLEQRRERGLHLLEQMLGKKERLRNSKKLCAICVQTSRNT